MGGRVAVSPVIHSDRIDLPHDDASSRAHQSASDKSFVVSQAVYGRPTEPFIPPRHFSAQDSRRRTNAVILARVSFNDGASASVGVSLINAVRALSAVDYHRRHRGSQWLPHTRPLPRVLHAVDEKRLGRRQVPSSTDTRQQNTEEHVRPQQGQRRAGAVLESVN